ncbi:putative aldouronate transport system substrate-binding protein [Cohnella sp. OV330]|uniref:ABC transporter substrate-binding protein n=1 Tax=Cohnella sp. OV330 TaxID=1855288 RepID=UPI0008F1BDE3|nr:ABC transporter substrate-binding protein [Cohnella sp. OV330]SFA92022.1 putative aldouronate transport system substrate-binding protein [Cohnella sp. OV330]
MSKKKKAWLGTSTVLAFSMLASACSGGNGNNAASGSPSASATATSSASASASPTASASASAIDTSEHVKLKMVLVGPKAPDTDEVYAEVNKILTEKINAELEVRFLDWGEMNQKYPLLFAANEDFDMAFTSSWAFYNPTARKDGFLELTEDLLKTYAPNTWANQDPVGWDQAKIDGKIYMVPQDAFESGSAVAMVRGDLREKYNIPELKTQADFVNYVKTIAKNEKGIVAYNGPPTTLNGSGSALLFLDLEKRWVHGSAPLVYDMNSESPQLINYLEDPASLAKIDTMYDMAQAGVWPKDAIVAKTDWHAAFKEGKMAADAGNILTASATMEAMNLAHPEWKVEVYDLSPDAKRFQDPLINNGVGIHATSKHPERALMALDLLRYDRELFELTTYGIKGKHWEPVGEDRYKVLPGSTGYTPDGVCPWGWRTELVRTLDGPAGDLLQSFYKKWKENNIIHSPLETFALDDANIKNELAALANVQKTYLLPIYFGLVKPSEGIPEVIEKMKQAGLDKVQAEMQKQLDAYVASHKA